MKGILLNLFQIFGNDAVNAVNNASNDLPAPKWLNKYKQLLFLNHEEIFFGADWIKLMDGDSELYIDWQEVDFFYYPFVGVNIKLPGFTESKYFSLIVREEKENSPFLNDFIKCLREQTEVRLSG